jgi:hypothetical protein
LKGAVYTLGVIGSFVAIEKVAIEKLAITYDGNIAPDNNTATTGSDTNTVTKIRCP